MRPPSEMWIYRIEERVKGEMKKVNKEEMMKRTLDCSSHPARDSPNQRALWNYWAVDIKRVQVRFNISSYGHKIQAYRESREAQRTRRLFTFFPLFTYIWSLCTPSDSSSSLSTILNGESVSGNTTRASGLFC